MDEFVCCVEIYGVSWMIGVRSFVGGEIHSFGFGFGGSFADVDDEAETGEGIYEYVAAIDHAFETIEKHGCVINILEIISREWSSCC